MALDELRDATIGRLPVKLTQMFKGRGIWIAGFILLAALPALISFDTSDSNDTSPPPFEVASLDALTQAKSPVEWDESDLPPTMDGMVAWDRNPNIAEAEESNAVEFDCMIEPWEEVSIRSTVIGRIDAIHVERADFIHEGDLLLELDADLAHADLDVASKRADMTSSIHSLEARRSLGNKRSKRAIELYSQNAMALDAKDEILTEKTISHHELQDARDQHSLAILELAREQARYEQRRIRSPVTGVVADRLMSIGEVVDEETVLEIAQIDPLRVEVILPAIEFGAIKNGMKAAVIPEIPGDDVVIATVRVVDGIIDSASGTFGAELELPNPEHLIPGGLRCRVQFMEAQGEETASADELARLEAAVP